MVICALAFVVTVEPAAHKTMPKATRAYPSRVHAARRLADAQAFNDTSDTLVLRVVQVSDVQQLLDHMERGLVDLVFLDRVSGRAVDSGLLANPTRIQRDAAPSLAAVFDMVRDERGLSSSRSNVYLM